MVSVKRRRKKKSYGGGRMKMKQELLIFGSFIHPWPGIDQWRGFSGKVRDSRIKVTEELSGAYVSSWVRGRELFKNNFMCMIILALLCFKIDSTRTRIHRTHDNRLAAGEFSGCLIGWTLRRPRHNVFFQSTVNSSFSGGSTMTVKRHIWCALDVWADPHEPFDSKESEGDDLII